MATLAASAYFLTCCRPTSSSTFCFRIEPPKLIQFHHYLPEFRGKYLDCNQHQKLNDHCLNTFNSCTDSRAWSLDKEQQRQHFLDIIYGYIPLCGLSDFSPKPDLVKLEENDFNKNGKRKKRETLENPKKEASKKKKSKDKKKDVPKEPSVIEIKEIFKEPSDVDLIPSKEFIDTNVPEKPLEELSATQIPEPPKKKSVDEDTALLTDDILDKLDSNLVNLETTFDKFIKKNRDFIQNLVKCLCFEKQKQKALESNYNQLKQENESLRMKNHYLKMVNEKQVQLFKDELDKGISENKADYKKKMYYMERQLQTEQDELQYYKQTERRFLEVVENDNKEITQLRNDIAALKEKETKLLKNYVQILNFLEDVKRILNSPIGSKEPPQKRSSNTITNSGINPNLNEVLTTALNNGMKSLNVRDLSILHDAIQELNERLCHQNDFCGKNPLSNMTMSRFSMIYTEEYPSTDYLPKGFQDYETPSNLSMYPSRQKPDESHARFL